MKTRSGELVIWPASSPAGAEPVLLQQPAAGDHLLDVGRALADQQHRGLPVEPLDLVLLGVAVAAVDPEGVLDDLLAVLAGQVLGHPGLQAVALAGALPPRGHPPLPV